MTETAKAPNVGGKRGGLIFSKSTMITIIKKELIPYLWQVEVSVVCYQVEVSVVCRSKYLYLAVFPFLMRN